MTKPTTCSMQSFAPAWYVIFLHDCMLWFKWIFNSNIMMTCSGHAVNFNFCMQCFWFTDRFWCEPANDKWKIFLTLRFNDVWLFRTLGQQVICYAPKTQFSGVNTWLKTGDISVLLLVSMKLVRTLHLRCTWRGTCVGWQWMTLQAKAS
jgi:hypothetical protein